MLNKELKSCISELNEYVKRISEEAPWSYQPNKLKMRSLVTNIRLCLFDQYDTNISMHSSLLLIIRFVKTYVNKLSNIAFIYTNALNIKESAILNIQRPAHRSIADIEINILRTRLMSLYKSSIHNSIVLTRNLTCLTYNQCLSVAIEAIKKCFTKEHIEFSKEGITLQCRICSKKVKALTINQHSELCKKYYHSLKELKDVDARMLSYINNINDSRKEIHTTSTNSPHCFFDTIVNAQSSIQKIEESERDSYAFCDTLEIPITKHLFGELSNKSHGSKIAASHFNLEMSKIQVIDDPSTLVYKQLVLSKNPSYHLKQRGISNYIPDILELNRKSYHRYEAKSEFIKKPQNTINLDDASLNMLNDTSQLDASTSKSAQRRKSKCMANRLEEQSNQKYKYLEKLKCLFLKAFNIKASRNQLYVDSLESLIVLNQQLKLKLLNDKEYKLICDGDKLLNEKKSLLEQIISIKSKIKYINYDTIVCSHGEARGDCSLLPLFNLSADHSKEQSTEESKVLDKSKYFNKSQLQITCLNNSAPNDKLWDSTLSLQSFHSFQLEKDIRRTNSNIIDYYQVTDSKKKNNFSRSYTSSVIRKPEEHSDTAIKFNVSIKDFKILKPLSKGAYGCVCLAQKIGSGDYFALKILDRKNVIEKNQIEFVNKEQKILQMISNDLVVKCFYTFQTEMFLFFVLEYMVGGDLGTLLRWAGALYEEDARFYLAHIISAVEILHMNNIVHRDLKPDNILIDQNGHIKLTDFGLSEMGLQAKYSTQTLRRKSHNNSLDAALTKNKNIIANSSLNVIQNNKLNYAFEAPGQSPIIGTPNYLAPEIIKGGEQSYALDWWSVGIIAFQMLTGYLPFQAESIDKILENIVNHRVVLPRIGTKDNEISPEAHNLLYTLLDPNPSTRLGSANSLEIKTHPFFKSIDWNNVHLLNPPQIPDVTSSTDTKFFDPTRASFTIGEFVKENYDEHMQSWRADNKLVNFSNVMIDSVADLNIKCAQKLIGDFNKKIV